MKIVGTAGHVDHGKSTLVKALTGTNPDRLKEEQERQMTIDLGFASMNLKDDLEVGFIDVPGHIDFIENMLMGVGGIDAALLVVAADEGVMPQTKEHLDILKLLKIERKIIALTKMDLVENEWLELVKEELDEFFIRRGEKNVSIIPVSGTTEEGLEYLKAAIHDVLLDTPDRKNYETPRLFVDRVFTLPGFGTIVTGTIIDGSFNKGQKVEILPGRQSARIRGLQSFNQEREKAGPGNRLAINLSGISVEDISRGMSVVLPGTYIPTSRIDVAFSLLPDLNMQLIHNIEVKLFHGSSQTKARVRLLGKTELFPGEEGLLQLELDHPIVARHGDHYILRRPSPSDTIGGGEILDPFPERRHRRFDKNRLKILEQIHNASSSQIVEHIVRNHGIISGKELINNCMMPNSFLQKQIEHMSDDNMVEVLNTGGHAEFVESIIIHSNAIESLIGTMYRTLEDYHSKNKHLRGMPAEVLRSRMKLDQQAFLHVLQRAIQDKKVRDDHGKICVFDFEVFLEEKDQRKAEELMEIFSARPLNTPSVTDIIENYGERIFNYLKDQEILLQISDQVVFTKKDIERMKEELKVSLKIKGSMKVTEVKEIFPTSRKYILAFLEHMDSLGITKRIGDERVLK